MRFVTLFIAFAFLPALLFAQRTFPEFGKPDMTELGLKSCAFEPEANAMVLFDVQEVEYEAQAFGDRVNTIRRVRIKILNEKGYDAGTVRIPYYSKRKLTKVNELKGTIFSLDASGQVVTQAITESDFYFEKAQKKVAVIKFTFPNLKAGSVLEYYYSITEKDRAQLDPWIIQREIPVAYASNVIITPAQSDVRSAAFGNDSINVKIEAIKKGIPRNKMIFEKENTQSFTAEPFMSSYTDNLLRIAYSLTTNRNFGLSWATVGSVLLRAPFFGGQVEKPIQATNFIIDSAYRIKVKLDRARYIYEQVRNWFKEKTHQTILPGDLEEAWQNHSGNTADINLILLNLLKRADIAAYPILVSTRENGKVNVGFPAPGQLNGVNVIVKNGDDYFVLDASIKLQPFHAPPMNVVNREGYMLELYKMLWVEITDERFLLRDKTNVIAGLNKDGDLEGVAMVNYFDYSKMLKLDSSLQNDEKTKERDSKPTGLQIHSVTRENETKDREPLSERTEFTYETNKSGDFYFIKPDFLAVDNKNPFTQLKRKSDIDLLCNQQHEFSLSLEIPQDWEIESLPKNKIVMAPDSSFYFQRSINASKSNIFYSYTFEIRRAIFTKEEYEGIREFFSLMHSLMEEEIILKRKKK